MVLFSFMEKMIRFLPSFCECPSPLTVVHIHPYSLNTIDIVDVYESVHLVNLVGRIVVQRL